MIYYLFILSSSLLLCLTVVVDSQDRAGTAGLARGQHCRGFNPEEVPFPTPYITTHDRAARCEQLFQGFNASGTVNGTYLGKNTYHNPCKVECPLCEGERPPIGDANVLRTYPAHYSLKDDMAQCPNREDIEVYEHFIEDGYQCGPTHVCDNHCCVYHPELFPSAKPRRTTTPRPTTPANWDKPLSCEEEGFYRNPNDCHRFYRCHEVKGKFVTTLFDCNPLSLVFDDQFKVCVQSEDTLSCDDLDANIAGGN